MSLWQPIGTHCLSMATCDLFPQNMATFVAFFPKKSCCAIWIGFFYCQNAKPFPKKKTLIKDLNITKPPRCGPNLANLNDTPSLSQVWNPICIQIWGFNFFEISIKKSYSISEYLTFKNKKSPPCNHTHQTNKFEIFNCSFIEFSMEKNSKTQ